MPNWTGAHLGGHGLLLVHGLLVWSEGTPCFARRHAHVRHPLCLRVVQLCMRQSIITLQLRLLGGSKCV